jgi:hypothetical protein
MRSRRLLLLTLFVSAAAWAGPVGAPTPAAAIGDQDELAIAYGAGELVAVWKDRLDQTGSILAIRAARLDLTGKPIDAIPAAAVGGDRWEAV